MNVSAAVTMIGIDVIASGATLLRTAWGGVDLIRGQPSQGEAPLRVLTLGQTPEPTVCLLRCENSPHH